MKELFYNALLEGKIKPFDRVLIYTESPNLGVEYDYEEITVLDLDMSSPDQILIKYKIKQVLLKVISIGQMPTKHFKIITCFLYLKMKKK